MHKFIDAAKVAINQHEYDDKVSYRLCAMIVKGGKIVSCGFNYSSTNAFVEYYTDSVLGRGRDYLISTHAEMSAVQLVRSKIDLTGSKIFIARLKVDGTYGMAKPCVICRRVLLKYGIKRAIYSIGEEEYGVLKITDEEIKRDASCGRVERY